MLLSYKVRGRKIGWGAVVILVDDVYGHTVGQICDDRVRLVGGVDDHNCSQIAIGCGEGVNVLERAMDLCLPAEGVQLAKGVESIISAKGLVGDGIEHSTVDRCSDSGIVIAENAFLTILHGTHKGRRLGTGDGSSSQLSAAVVPFVDVSFGVTVAVGAKRSVDEIGHGFGVFDVEITVP